MSRPRRILFLGGEPRVRELVGQLFGDEKKFVLKEEEDYRYALRTARAFRPNGIFYGQNGSDPHWQETLFRIQEDAALRRAPLFRLALSPDGRSIVYAGSLDGYEFFAESMKIDELIR